MDRGLIEKKIGATKAGVALTALRIEDPERGPFARRPVSITSDQGLRPLADDVPPKPDPGAADELQAQAGGFSHSGG